MELSLPRHVSFALRCLDSCLSWIFQTECLACGVLVHTQSLCDACGTLTPCKNRPFEVFDAIDGARSAFWLTDSHLAVLHRVKYRFQREWLDFYRQPVLSHFVPFFPQDTVVVPVPLHWRRRFQRGFNQSQIIASWLANAFHYSMSTQLVKSRATRPQSELGRRERTVNLHNVFQWKGRAPRRVLLIDDILTTGATLEACAAALKKEGVQAVYAWTPFRTPKYA